MQSACYMSLYKKNGGFSLLEVMVTAAIIGIITAVVVINYGSFNNTILLRNQAFEIALQLREAQVYAVSVRGDSTEFREEYGIYFDMSNSQQYLLFQDIGSATPAYYDVGEGVGKASNIDSRFALDRICVNFSSSEDCSNEVDDLSISFKRPDFDAQFASVDGFNQGLGTISNARIELRNLQGNNIRSVVVQSSGQIKIE